MNKFHITPGWGFARYHEQIGIAMELLSRDPLGRFSEINILQETIAPAIRHRQIAFAFDELSKPVGFLIWAYLSEEVQLRLLTEHSLRLHESEWSEGEQIWVLKLVAPMGDGARIIRHARRTLLSGGMSAQSLKLVGQSGTRKISRWTHAPTGTGVTCEI